MEQREDAKLPRSDGRNIFDSSNTSLLQTVEQLAADLRNALKEIDHLRNDNVYLNEENERLMKENERLKKENERLKKELLSMKTTSDRLPLRTFDARGDPQILEWLKQPAKTPSGFRSSQTLRSLPLYEYEGEINDILSKSDHTVTVLSARTGVGKTLCLPEMVRASIQQPSFKLLLVVPGRDICEHVCSSLRKWCEALYSGYLCGRRPDRNDHKNLGTTTPNIIVMTTSLATAILSEMMNEKDAHIDAVIFDEFHDRSPALQYAVEIAAQLAKAKRLRKIIFTSATIFDKERIVKTLEEKFEQNVEYYECPAESSGEITVQSAEDFFYVSHRNAIEQAYTSHKSLLEEQGVKPWEVNKTMSDMKRLKLREQDALIGLLKAEDDLILTPDILEKRLFPYLKEVIYFMMEKNLLGNSIIIFLDGVRTIKALRKKICKWTKNHQLKVPSRAGDARRGNPMKPNEKETNVNVFVQMIHSQESVNEKAHRDVGTNDIRVYLSTNAGQTSYTLPRVRYIIDGTLQKVPIARTAESMFGLEVQQCDQLSITQRKGRGGRTGKCEVIYPITEPNLQKDRVGNHSVNNLKNSFSLEDYLTSFDYNVDLSNIIDPISMDKLEMLLKEARLCGLTKRDAPESLENDIGHYFARVVRRCGISVRAVKGLIVSAHLGILEFAVYALAATEFGQMMPYPQPSQSVDDDDYGLNLSRDSYQMGLNRTERNFPGAEHLAISEFMRWALTIPDLDADGVPEKVSKEVFLEIRKTVNRMSRACQKMGLIPGNCKLNDYSRPYNRKYKCEWPEYEQLMRVTMAAAMGDHLCKEGKYETQSYRVFFENDFGRVYPESFLPADKSNEFAVYNSGYANKKKTALITCINRDEAIVFGNLFADWTVDNSSIIMKTNVSEITIDYKDSDEAMHALSLRREFQNAMWNFAQSGDYSQYNIDHIMKLYYY